MTNKDDITQTGQRGVHKTKFADMLIFDLNIFTDPRGSFTEVWQSEAMEKMGLPKLQPKQLGVSLSKQGTIRAIHAEPYDKIVSALTGRIYCAMVDLRPESETFGEVDSFELDSTQMLYIPNGIGNATQAISEEDVLYCYCVTGIWSAEKAYSGQYIAIHYADPDLNIQWPIRGGKEIVSNKDRQNKLMRDYFPEHYV